MKRFLLTTAAFGLIAGSAAAAPITGVVNFDGSNSYNSTSITFVGEQNVSSDSGTLAALGACTSCVTAKNLTWNPAAPLADWLDVTNNLVHFSLDLGAQTFASFVPGVDLDLKYNATLHETGFADTTGVVDISTQGPNDIEVSFSATAIANVPEPASLAILGFGLLGLGLVTSRKRSA